MLFFIPKETKPGETRIPVLPEAVKKIIGLGATVQVEAGLGSTLHIEDKTYEEAGATVAADLKAALAEADVVLRLNKPSGPEGLKEGAIHVSYLDPFFDLDNVKAFAAAKVSAVCMEMIPRTTIAQKMDALSSQASLAGYAAVIQAAAKLQRSLPMMMTPAGTLSPCKVFVIGAGVAGLQAIATAKRLGARVEAFDTRPVVEEQVASLGAKFLKIDLGETGQTAGGYAKELTPEQLAKQQEAMGKAIAKSDIVITTAKLFGRPAPKLITDAQIAGMTPGSVIVDMAAGSGGNVEGSKPDEDVVLHGVTVVGDTNLEGRVPYDASQMYGSNLFNFVQHFWNKETSVLELRRDDEIIEGSLLTHAGEVVHNVIKERIG
ncbi:MAG: NAD(P) transhydrogenase subunit alpha [Verrucomicrobia bacterium]|nr:NAD(P) transhydrogenase subunit alpha [Verrucomicrobiota bacterium]MCH8528473.1 NAD(P) transhydrogenase subunit alpha [Kiritimatiellia bacterium]